MKKIKYFILEKFKDSSKSELYEMEYESLLDLFNNDIPEEYIEKIKNGEFNDFIIENLNTHNVKQLQDKIRKEFDDKYVFGFEETLNYDNEGKEKYNKKSFYIIATDKIINKMSKDEDLENLIKFYGYYISKAKDDYILVCPLYAEHANDLVYKENHGILYHFTTSNNDESILKNGLRCKQATYRKFPERIYLYSKYKLDNNDKKFIDKVTDPFKRRKYGISIFKINLNKIGKDISFYTDDYMEEDEAVYTYTNIPAECISKIKYEI